MRMTHLHLKRHEIDPLLNNGDLIDRIGYGNDVITSFASFAAQVTPQQVTIGSATL